MLQSKAEVKAAGRACEVVQVGAEREALSGVGAESSRKVEMLVDTASESIGAEVVVALREEMAVGVTNDEAACVWATQHGP